VVYTYPNRSRLARLRRWSRRNRARRAHRARSAAGRRGDSPAFGGSFGAGVHPEWAGYLHEPGRVPPGDARLRRKAIGRDPGAARQCRTGWIDHDAKMGWPSANLDFADCPLGRWISFRSSRASAGGRT